MNKNRLIYFFPLLVSIFEQPLTMAIGIIPMILVRDFGVSGSEIAMFSIVRPASLILSLLIPNLSCIFLNKKQIHLHVLIAGILSRVPLAILPFVKNSTSFFIFAFIFHIVLSKSIKPFWIEAIRIILKEKRSKCISDVTKFSYVQGIITTVLIGMILDSKIVDGITLISVIGVLSVPSSILQAYFCYYSGVKYVQKEKNSEEKIDGICMYFKTIKEPNVFRFHIIFTFLGISALLSQVIFPLVIGPISRNVSYTYLSTSITVARVLGVYVSSHFWNILFKRGIFISSFFIGVFCFLYSCFIVIPYVFGFNIIALFLTYFLFGVTLAGSMLTWDLAPTVLCKNGSSTNYSKLNILMLGIRGFCIPLITGFLLDYSFNMVVVFSIVSSFIGTLLSMFFKNNDG